MSLATALRGCLSGGVVFVDPVNRVITLSTEAFRLLGMAAPREPRWENLPAALRELAAEAVKTGHALAPRLIQVATTTAPDFGLEVSALPVARNGKTSGVVLLLASLASLQQCEERLQRLDRLANLGTLAASMAHEIKNALVAGRTFVDLLLEKNPEAELSDVVRRELTRIDALVARLLKFARAGHASLADLRVHETLEHALRLLQPQLENRGITLDRRLEAGADLVAGDEGELVQALMNLLLNALEAMEPDGKLTVVTANSAGAGAAVPVPAEIHILIADTGMGIPPEHFEHLFEPFFTTKTSGTGLGLAVTKRIIAEHHGAITVESRPGQGTSFRIVLPVVSAA